MISVIIRQTEYCCHQVLINFVALLTFIALLTFLLYYFLLQ